MSWTRKFAELVELFPNMFSFDTTWLSLFLLIGYISVQDIAYSAFNNIIFQN